MMAPSWVSTSISMFLKSQKAFLLALEPLRQISADLSKAKDVLALIQEIVFNNNNNNNSNNNNSNNVYILLTNMMEGISKSLEW